MHCPYCNQEHPENAQFCTVTGKALTPAQMTCPNCHREIPPASPSCPYCMVNFSQTGAAAMASSPSPKQGGGRGRGLFLLFSVLTLIGGVLVLVGGFLVLTGGKETGQPAAVSSSGGDETPVSGGAKELHPTVWMNPTANPLSTEAPEPTSTLARPSKTPTRQLVAKVPPTVTPGPSKTPQPTATTKIVPTYPVNSVDAAELVFIPAGEFVMGSDAKIDPYFYGAEGPQHTVDLDEFWIYRTEVTNAMYQKCAQASVCPRPVYKSSETRDEYYGNPAFADYPVVWVSWRGATAYCSWAGARLPTEAEWEKAARGTDKRLFPWGSQSPNDNLACYAARDTCEVGSHPDGASPYGVLDMAGNVIEWVFDYFSSAYYDGSPAKNPIGPASSKTHVYRSGSFHNDAGAIRVVMRGSREADHTSADIGFRCAMDQP